MQRPKLSLNQTLHNLLIGVIVLVVAFAASQFFIYRITFDRIINGTTREVVSRMDNALALSLEILDARFTRIEPGLRDRHQRAMNIITTPSVLPRSVNLDTVRSIIADGVTSNYDVSIVDETGTVINSTDKELFGARLGGDEYSPTYLLALSDTGQPHITSPMLDFDDSELLAVASSRMPNTSLTLVTTYTLKNAEDVYRQIWSDSGDPSGIVRSVSIYANAAGRGWTPVFVGGEGNIEEHDAELSRRALTQGRIFADHEHENDHRVHTYFIPATTILPVFSGGNAHLVYKIRFDLITHHAGLRSLSITSGVISFVLILTIIGIMVWVRRRVLSPFFSVVADITSSRPVTNPAVLGRGDELTLLAKAFNKHIEHFYAGVMEQSPVGVAIFDPDSLAYVAGNTRFPEFVGHTPSSMPKLTDIIGNDTDTLSAVINARAEAEYDITATDIHGLSRTLRILVYPGTHAGRTMVCAGLLDISDRVAYERQNALQASMLEQVDSAVAAVDTEFNVIFWNEAAEKLFGYTAEQAIGQPMRDMIKPGDNTEQIDRGRDIVATTGRMAGQMTLSRANGELFEAEVTVNSIIGIDEDVIGYVGVTKDITARLEAEREIAESEERFRTLSRQFAALLDAIPDAIVLIASDFRILWANRAAMAMYGTEAERLTGEYCYELIRGEEFQCEHCPAHICLSLGEISSHTRLMPDGRRIEVTLYPIPTEGEINQFIHVGRDITEKLRIESEAGRTRHLSLLGQLSAGIAHEINNPNNFITLNAAMLKDIWKDAEKHLEHRVEDEGGAIMLAGLPWPESAEDIRKLISSIEDGAVRIKTIVADLKKFATQDRMPQVERVRVNDVVRAATAILKNRIKTAGCAFTVDYGDSIPTVRGNTGKLEQVVMNIIMNAIESLADPAHGSVSVATVSRNGGKTACIIIADTGSGMDETTIERVFEPFYSTKFKSGGTGLGMSITYSIVKEHGGDITVKSKPGKGTTMTVCLPSSS